MSNPTPNTPNTKKMNQRKHNKCVKEEKRLERIKQELKLRKLGFTYREIGDKLGIDHTVVFDDVKSELNKIIKETSEDADAVRRLELERIDSVLPNVMIAARSGDYKAIDAMIKLMDRRSKYLGLDAALKQEQAGIVTVYLNQEQDKEL